MGVNIPIYLRRKRKLTQDLYQAIAELSPESAEQAIALGADINAHDKSRGGAHPFEILMTLCWTAFLKDAKPDEPANFIKIGHTLLAMPQIDLCKISAEFGQCPLDRIVMARNAVLPKSYEWVHLAASAVIKTLSQNIQEQTPPYEPNIPAVFRLLGTVGDATGIRGQALDTLQAVHACVRRRLDAPETQMERQAARLDVLSNFWRTGFIRPDPDALPLPSTALVKEMHGAAAFFTEAAEKKPYALLELLRRSARIQEIIQESDDPCKTPDSPGRRSLKN